MFSNWLVLGRETIKIIIKTVDPDVPFTWTFLPRLFNKIIINFIPQVHFTCIPILDPSQEKTDPTDPDP